MSYRDFSAPSDWRAWEVEDWMQWADEEGLLIDVGPSGARSCAFCHGAVNGDFTLCYQCDGPYLKALDGVLAVTYSVDAGLESLLHRYKDHDGYGWARRPLASMLWSFLDNHLQCIVDAYGRPDLVTTAPSGSVTRGFHPLRRAVGWLTDDSWPFEWRADVVDFVGPTRPDRGKVQPEKFRATTKVRGASVLLVDDTWTSGATQASIAACLKSAGASSVTALTIGRQLNMNYTHTGPLLDCAKSSRYDSSRCVLCG